MNLPPRFVGRGRVARAIGFLLIFGVLTLLTQVGGLVYVVSRWISGRLLKRLKAPPGMARWALRAGSFAVLYALATFVLVPLSAPLVGREALPCRASEDRHVEAHTVLTCVLNRNYARAAVAQLLEAMSMALDQRYPGTTVEYLDANFPFIDGFPMLPHVSHDDGRKIDLAYFYRSTDPTRPGPVEPASPIGYWAYEQPRPGEARPCEGQRSFLRWDFDWLQPVFAGTELDPERTAAMLDWLEEHGPAYGVTRILLETHLQERLGAHGPLVRFQGCAVARHDDHMHLSLR
jgi:hypothetical protein